MTRTMRSECKEVKPEKKCQKVAGVGDSLTFGSVMVRNICMHYVWCCQVTEP